jgi:hypothetical protein
MGNPPYGRSDAANWGTDARSITLRVVWTQANQANEASGNSRFDTQAPSRHSQRNVLGDVAMAKLALIYGMRLLPEEDLGEVKDAIVVLKNGKSVRVTMHLIEGSKEEIEATFHQSVEAFFEMYPEI